MTVRIGIDPGHGGRDTGAIANGLIEAEWVWYAAWELSKRIERSGNTPVVTREFDTDPSFARRGWRTRDCEAVISLHVNAHAQPQVNGLEVYHWPGSVHGALIAGEIATRCPELLLPRGQGAGRIISVEDDPATTKDDWLQRPRSVLKWHRAPAVLVECGYCSNEGDLAYLVSPTGMLSVIEAVYSGVLEWVNAYC